MKLKKLMEQINDLLTQSAYESIDDESDYGKASAYISLQSGDIDINIDGNGIEVNIIKDNERKSPNLEKFIEDNIYINWEYVDNLLEEDRCIAQGLDPAFSSWNDYYNYMYG
jgi:hypothetical protein